MEVFRAAVLVLVNEFLWLFDAKSELEGFLSQGQSSVEEHFVRIAVLCPIARTQTDVGIVPEDVWIAVSFLFSR